MGLSYPAAIFLAPTLSSRLSWSRCRLRSAVQAGTPHWPALHPAYCVASPSRSVASRSLPISRSPFPRTRPVGGFQNTQSTTHLVIVMPAHPDEPSASTPLLGHVHTAPAAPVDNDHFAPDDPDNPRNWPSWRKWLIVAVITPIDLSVSWGASGFSPATESFRHEFGLSETAATLGLSLYILGLALGPMSLAPLSEFFGRSVIYIYSYAVFLLLLAATALVDSVVGFMVLRFFSGLFAAVTVGKMPKPARTLPALIMPSYISHV